jgi:hypothetical protein
LGDGKLIFPEQQINYRSSTDQDYPAVMMRWAFIRPRFWVVILTTSSASG